MAPHFDSMKTTLLTLALTPFFATAQAQDEAPTWPQFRGVGGVAVAAETPIPLDFGPESKVLWKATIPPGHSSPCVYGGRIFITGASEEGLAVIAVDRGDGSIVWTRTFEGEEEPDFGHVASAPAMPTPCTDGQRVFAYFGAYGLIALDFEGETLWEKRLPVPPYQFGASPSPVLAGGHVILARDGAAEASVLALNVENGEEVWSIPRFGFIEAHASPFVWKTAEREELVLTGTKQLRSYDPATGKELWNVDNVTLFACTTPTADEKALFYAGWSTPNASAGPLVEQSFGSDFEYTAEEAADFGLIFDRLDADKDGHVTIEEVPPSRARDAFVGLDADKNGTWERSELAAASGMSSTPGKNVALAIKAGGEGDVTESHVLWSWTRGLPYVSSPLLYRGRLWLFKAGGLLTCLDAETGKPIINRERLPAGGEYYMSPVGAAGHVLAASSDGTLFIFDATTDELEIVHSVDFGESLYATPAVLEGKVYLRTPTTLWAFGE